MYSRATPGKKLRSRSVERTRAAHSQDWEHLSSSSSCLVSMVALEVLAKWILAPSEVSMQTNAGVMTVCFRVR